jgi:hypothetical protein
MPGDDEILAAAKVRAHGGSEKHDGRVQALEAELAAAKGANVEEENERSLDGPGRRTGEALKRQER